MSEPMVTMVLILRPDFKNQDHHGKRIYPKLSDYIEVPRLSQFGTFRIVDMLPFETLAKLSRLRDQLDGVKRRK